MKKLFLFLLILSTATYAQKKNFTMAEATNGLSTTLAVKNLSQLKWTGSSEYFAYVVANDSENVIIANSPATFESETVMSLEKMNKQLEKLGVKKINKFPGINWINHTSFFIIHDNKYIQFNTLAKDSTETQIMAELPKDAENVLLNSKREGFAFIANFNLFYQQGNKAPIQITQDGNANLLYGTSVHRDEFGITGGIFWSPTCDAIAFYRMDQSMVEDYPIVNWNETPATVKNIKYPFAGRQSHHVSLGVYNVKTGATTYLKTGEPKDQYLTSVTWSPDGKSIYVALLNRDQNHLQLNQYDAVTGEKVKTLFEEKNERYVEPQHELYFLSNNPNQFVWWSQRDGFMHLYLYGTDGTLIRQLTKGNWIVNEIVGFNKKTQEIIFSGTKESPLQKNVYAVNVVTAKMRSLSKTLASHQVASSADGNYLIDVYSNRLTPRNIEVVNVNTLADKRIFTASDPLREYQTANIELVKLYSADSTLLYGKLLLPQDFDANKKYPVIVYLYNGPHVQLIKDAFPYSGNLWYDYLTQNGYIVFTMDGRGSSNRGFQFESAIHRQLGTLEMEDQLTGVSYLKSLPYVDANRMGVHGWSYGGFMTTSLMLRKPGVFKCGVAGGPVLDWSMYEIMYGERYMDSPEQNADGYKANLLVDKVKNLQGNLLLIHGADDDVVVWQHSLKLIKKSVEEGVQIDYFVYPGHPHNVRGKDRVHLMQKITDYFDAHLK
jgi:dipeptidyl-peptidase-4